MWNQLASRYDCIEKTQIYLEFAHDPDFKFILHKELSNILEKQADVLEKLMNKFKLPLPSRPPKSVNIDSGRLVVNDRLIYRDILSGCENFMETQVHAVRTSVTNDFLRTLFVKYLNQELVVYDDLCKYGKVKGWLEVPPLQQA